MNLVNEITFNLFNKNLPAPQIHSEFGTYELKNIKFINIFYNTLEININ